MKAILLAVAVVLAPAGAAPVSAVYHKIGGYLPTEMIRDAWGGEGHALVAGGYSGFHVLDTSDPVHPIPLYTYVTEGPAWRVIEDRARAYVIDWWNGMLVFDVSDPAAPELLGESPAFNLGYDVLIDGDLAYVGNQTSLRSMNVSDPADILLLHVFPVTNGVWSLQKQGNTMYVAGWSAGVLVIDVTNPTSFHLEHTIDTIDRAYVVEVVDGVAFVADGWAGVLAIDIRDPAHPVMLCQYAIPGCVQWLDVQGSIAYATSLESGFHVLDVSDPTHIAAIDAFHIPGSAERAMVRDRLAYVADGGRGLHIVDISDPSVPILVGAYRDLAGVNEVRGAGDVVFLADEYGGLVAVDVTDPSQPAYLAGVDVEGNERCVDVENALVACGTNYYAGGNLEFYTTLPGAPLQHTSSHIAYGAAGTVALRQGIAYAAVVEDDWHCIECVKASDPYHPQLLSRVPMEAQLASLCVDGGTVLCAVGSEGLHIYDYSNLLAPQMIASLDTPGRASAIAAAGGYAYIADGQAGVQIVDLSDPHNPGWVGTLRPHDDCVVSARPEIHEGRLYVADENWNTITTYDLADPAAPTRIEEIAWNYRSLTMDAVGGLLYTANFWAGMCALDVRAPSAVTPPASAAPVLRLSVANPLRAPSTLAFHLTGEAARTELAIFDLCGRTVKTLVDGRLPRGDHAVIWSGRDDRGRDVPAGLYLCGMRHGASRVARKVLLVR